MIFASLILQALVILALAAGLLFVLLALGVLVILRRWLRSEGDG